jgi:hypothetical protein
MKRAVERTAKRSRIGYKPSAKLTPKLKGNRPGTFLDRGEEIEGGIGMAASSSAHADAPL